MFDIKKEMGIAEIKEILPHRPPFLFLNSFKYIDLEHGEGYFLVEIEHPILKGHFPDTPIMPGVLIIEHAAQTAGVLKAFQNKLEIKSDNLNVTNKGFLASIKDFKFIKPIIPPVQLVTQIELTRSVFDLTLFQAKTFVNNELVAKGVINIYHDPK